METLLKAAHDYAVEALKLYRILKTENNESYLGRKIIQNGLETGLNLRTYDVSKPDDKQKANILSNINEMKFILDVLKDSGYFEGDVITAMTEIIKRINEGIGE